MSGSTGTVRGGCWLAVLALLTAVAAADQATKWWAWRHVSDTIVNPGGDLFVGSHVSSWYADPVAGPLLDLLDLAVVSAAVVLLARHRRPATVLVSGAVMLGGWASNLLDRLGLHALTAPGSARGAVDFIHLGDPHFNVADLAIAAATPLFLLAVGRHRPRARIVAFLGAASFVSVLAIGAATHGV
jgi:lipoprotein signal peptidase